MNWLDAVLIVACVVLVALPSKHDPVIRWKERNEGKRK